MSCSECGCPKAVCKACGAYWDDRDDQGLRITRAVRRALQGIPQKEQDYLTWCATGLSQEQIEEELKTKG